MMLARRLLLTLIAAVAAARVCAYLVYAAATLPTPLEAYHMEAKMVLLAYRARIGESLYPLWQDYPHVANFYGPVYFALVGLLGKALGADIPALFSIGRVVTFLSGLAASLIVGVSTARRYGPRAGVAGGLVSLGVAPMIGFSVMVRPDVLADVFGLGGFLLGGGRGRRTQALGGLLLALAILTKQTCALYLVAAVVGLALEGGWRRAWPLLAACTIPLAVVIVGVNALVEPNFVRSLLGDSKTPLALANAAQILRNVVRFSPDLLLLPMIGVSLWLTTTPRDVRLATLALVLLAGSIVSAGKLGSDVNYYLGLRAVEGLAAGALWQAAQAAVGRKRWAVLAACALVVASLLPSLAFAFSNAQHARNQAEFVAGPLGRSYLRIYQSLFDKVRDPNVHLLTDSGLVDLYQGERAAFGDPLLFRVMVDTGRINPVTMRERVENEYYEIIVTTADLMSDWYPRYDRGLPPVLAEPARARYRPLGASAGLFFYGRRGDAGRPRTPKEQ